MPCFPVISNIPPHARLFNFNSETYQVPEGSWTVYLLFLCASDKDLLNHSQVLREQTHTFVDLALLSDTPPLTHWLYKHTHTLMYACTGTLIHISGLYGRGVEATFDPVRLKGRFLSACETHRLCFLSDFCKQTALKAWSDTGCSSLVLFCNETC